ncbi:OmpP1/FadL family transporter [Hyphomicrobium zavarzinii]|uniref:OmpP1/FadL family transporter n=1 Tax=Hyphomicrobium zavarzinii TaxID=48292 RepID=UPI0009FC6BF7|nr:outer membrane protein transport protein [Hyphomicrobium zavarzinii]
MSTQRRVAGGARITGSALGTRLVLGFAVITFTLPAHANYAQTWGVSTSCLANAGACVASVDDIGSFYHNPAGAASMEGTVIGGSIYLLDVRNAESTDSLGTHNPDATSVDGEIAALPTLGLYQQIAPNAVIGLGIASPFGIVADWEDAGIFRYNSLDQSIVSIDVSPTLAWKPTENLRVGLAANFNVARQLGLNIGFPNVFLGPGNASSPLAGKISLETDKDWSFEGLPPGSLEFGLHAVSLTAGLQYDVNDRLTVGIAGRTKESQTWEGDFTLDLTPLGAGQQKTRFSMDIDAPAFVQLGMKYALLPNVLDVSFDWQRTFWSDTAGFGKPLVVKLRDTVFVGPVPADQLVVNYSAQDQNTWRFGATWHAMTNLDLRFGYAFDEAIFPDRNGDQITFDNDRHIFALGFSYDNRVGKTGSGWQFDGAFQVTHYEDKKLEAGESINLGGLGSPAFAAGAPTLGFTPNSEDATFGGEAYSLTLGATYHY